MAESPLSQGSLQDLLQEATKLLRAHALDIGTRYLGDLVGQKASTVQNQLAGTDDRRPSFDLAIATAWVRPEFKRELIALLEPEPDLEPIAAIHEIEKLVPHLGEHDAKQLGAILARVRKVA